KKQQTSPSPPTLAGPPLDVGHHQQTIIKQTIRVFGASSFTSREGGNNAEASGSASRQAQQAEPVVGQDGLGGSGVDVIIGLFVVDGAGGAGVGVGSQGSSHTRWTKRRVQTVRISP
nr:hypothetical protein [Tanacetum cinerariifolium]